MSSISVSQNLTELLAFLEFGRHYPDFPDNFIPPFVNNLNYIAPNKGTHILVAAVLTTAIGVLAVFARLVVRSTRGKQKWGWDDWSIILVMLLVVVSAVTQVLMVKRGGLGKHTWDCSIAELRFSYQFKLINLILGYAALGFMKASIVLLLWRISSPNEVNYRRKLAFTLAVLLVMFLGGSLMQILSCSPLTSQWNLNQRIFHSSSCRWEWQLPTGWILAYGLSDFWVLYLPVELIWQLNRPKRDRIGIIILFLLGFIASILALVKVRYVKGTYFSYDQSWNSDKLLIITQVEYMFGLIVTSLSALNFLFVKAIPHWMYKEPQSTVPKPSDQSPTSQEFVVEKTTVVRNVHSPRVDSEKGRDYDWRFEHTKISAPLYSFQECRHSQPPLSLSSTSLRSQDRKSFDLVIQSP